jgi:adenine-specific DNA-methyltransferase
MAKKPTIQKTVETINHDEAKRKNIPTAEHQSVIGEQGKNSKQVKYPRNTDLDPQLFWRGKDEQDWSDLVVNAPPLYIQEKVHPKAIIDDLLMQSKGADHDRGIGTADLFSDFDGIPHGVDKTEFYLHDQNWSNRMILGDSLQVMSSLAEREGLRGEVQCIYFDPPYGIKFNSNFQWSTTSGKDIKDGKIEHITREPEQVKAFRDTWRDGIHSYLTYLRDRLTVCRDLLADSGSIFIQIGDENVHLVRSLMDEIFGIDNFVSLITIKRASVMFKKKYLNNACYYVIWYAKDIDKLKYRDLYQARTGESFAENSGSHLWFEKDDLSDIRKATPAERNNIDSFMQKNPNYKVFATLGLNAQGIEKQESFKFEGRNHVPPPGTQWKTSYAGLEILAKSGHIITEGNTVRYKQYLHDYPVMPINSLWEGIGAASDKIYAVQTPTEIIKRCLLMASDPGDLVLDPTCGSGTTAYVAEEWGRRWITIDTSRVALVLARCRIMGAKFPYYFLADSITGQKKNADMNQTPLSTQKVGGSIKYGFVYQKVPHITLKSIANNLEINEIWDSYRFKLDEIQKQLSLEINKEFQDWEFPVKCDESWPQKSKELHKKWWQLKIEMQNAIDSSIASKAEYEVLYDKPAENKKMIRVAGPFTVESLSPYRMLDVDENDELIDAARDNLNAPKQSFTQMVLDNLKISGVQQAHKIDKLNFSSITQWPGELICAEGRYLEGGEFEKRAAIFVGPEFGTVQRADLVEAAKEAGDAGFDVLISCAFNYEAHATELNKLGNIQILKARMNADLHMSEDLKNTGRGNLFVVFGEPDIDVIEGGDNKIRVRINGIDVFKPQTGEVISDGSAGIACWFIDTDYNEESFLARHAYFLGANDPYTSLRLSLKAEINPEVWRSLNSDFSRPFPKPKSGRIAVKVINHLGDEVMKVFKV